MKVDGAEHVYFHLPYSAQLEVEAKEQLQQIKNQLVKCNEKYSRRKLIFWNRSLESFIKLKNPISPNDLESLITTLIFLLLKERDLTTQTKLANTTAKLLKKYDKYNRIQEFNGEFQIDWKSLLQLIERVHLQGTQYCGGIPLKSHLTSIKHLIQHSRRYFLKRTKDADMENQKIIEEMISLFQSTNLTSIEEFSIHVRQGLVSLLLPMNSPIAPKLILPFIFNNWKLVENCKSWDLNWFSLLNRLSEETFRASNFGVWDKEIVAEIFTQLLKLLDLSAPHSVNKPKHNNISPLISEIFSLSHHTDSELIQSISKIIANTLSDQTDTLDRYIQLIDLIYSYFHPSNGGDWSYKLGKLISCTTQFLEKRILFERKVLKNIAPLSNEIIEKISIKTFSVAIQGIYAKGDSLKVSSHQALKSLCWISPNLILPQLLQKLDTGLTTLNASHQTATSIQTLSYITTPFVNPNHYGDPSSLYSLLENSLPGIDANDFPKTSATLSFYLAVFVNIPFHDLTVGSNFDDSFEENGEFLSQTGQMKEISRSLFENFAIFFIDRMILFFSHITNEDDSEYKNLSVQFHLVLDTFFQHLSPELFKIVLTKIFTYVTNNVETTAKAQYSIIMKSLARSNPSLTLEKFVSFFSKLVIFTDKEDLKIPTFEKNISKEKLEWYLHLLSDLVRGSPGDVVNKYQNDLSNILRSCILSEDKSTFDFSTKLGSNILLSLTTTYIYDYKYFTSTKEIRWGKLFKLEDIKDIHWYQPTESEIGFAVQLITEIFSFSSALLSEFLNSSSNKDSLLYKLYQANNEEKLTVKETIQRSIKLLRIIVDGGDQLFQTEKIVYHDAHDIGESRISYPVLIRNKSTDPLPAFYDQIDSIYFGISELMHNLFTNIASKLHDDANSLKSIAKLIQFFFTGSNVWHHAHGTNYRIYSSLKEKYGSHLYKPTDYSNESDNDIRKFLLYRSQIMRIMGLHYKRICESKYSKILYDIHKQLLDDLLEASHHSHVQVRQKSQKYFRNSLKYFPQLKKQYIRQFIENINLDNCKEVDINKVKGSFHLIITPSCFKKITNDWQLQHDFISALTGKLFYNDSKTIQRLIYLILIHFSSQYYPLPFSSINKHQSIYEMIVSILLNKVTSSDPNQPITWKFQSMAGSLLYFYQSRDGTPTSIPALRWFCDNLLNDLLPLRSMSLFAIPSLLKIPIQPNISILPQNSDLTISHSNFRDYFSTFSTQTLNENQLEVLHVLSSYFLNTDQSGANFFSNFLRFLAEGHSTGERDNNGYDAKIRSFLSSFRAGHRSRFANFLNENITTKQLNFDIFNSSNLIRVGNLFPITKGQILSDRFSIETSRFFSSVFSTILLYSNQIDTTNDQLHKLLGVKVKEIHDELKDDVRNYKIEEEKRSSLYIELYASLVSSITKSSTTKLPEENQTFWRLMNQFHDVLFQENFKNFGSTEDLSTSFRFSLSQLDPNRYFSNLIPNLLSVNEPQGDYLSYLSNMNVPTQRHLKKLTCLREVLKEANYRSNFVFIENNGKKVRFTERLIHSILIHIDHPYLQVRESLASLLYLIFSYSWNNHTQLDETDREVQSILSNFVVNAIALIQRKENSISEQGDSEPLRKSLSNSLETMVLWMMNHFHSSDVGAIENHLHHLLPLIFKSIVNNEKDLSQKSRACLALSALSFYSRETITSKIIPTIFSPIILNATDNWRTRESALPFIQLIAFHHRFKLTEKELKEIHRAVIALLNDPQIEVRDMASSCLSSILRGATSAYITELFKQFHKSASVKIVKNNEQALLQRNSGVLGLIALVKLAPYDIPDWYPPVLMSLVRHVDDPILISKNVKGAIQDFWRTHRDMWDTYKDAFSYDEQEILNDLMVAPSYYA